MGISQVTEVLLEFYLVASRRISLRCSDARRWEAYGSGYRFNPSRSTSIAGAEPDVPLTVAFESLPSSLSARPGPYAFSFASRRIFVPSSL